MTCFRPRRGSVAFMSESMKADRLAHGRLIASLSTVIEAASLPEAGCAGPRSWQILHGAGDSQRPPWSGRRMSRRGQRDRMTMTKPVRRVHGAKAYHERGRLERELTEPRRYRRHGGLFADLVCADATARDRLATPPGRVASSRRADGTAVRRDLRRPHGADDEPGALAGPHTAPSTDAAPVPARRSHDVLARPRDRDDADGEGIGRTVRP